ncbi:HAMP domain-containing histidine kinase [Streptococcus gallolyticus]|nr:HAMP domain-containing histidine kinase [Streptococcus gallolyticus]MBY5041839.1 HAMP domain-containing histidine kinase [Streptococcus gallolyticus]
MWLGGSVYLLANLNHGVGVQGIQKIQPSLEDEKFSGSLFTSFTQHGRYYEVFEEKKGLVYTSNSDQEQIFSDDELDVMLPYSAYYYYSSQKYQDELGHTRYLIQKNKDAGGKYLAGEIALEKEEFSYLLDENFKVLRSADKNGPTQFTQRQLNIMTQELLSDYHLYKYHFMTKQGKKMTIVFFVPYDDDAETEAFLQKNYIAIGSLLVLFILILILFTIRIHRKIAGPLSLLQEAIQQFPYSRENRLSENRYVPREFEEILATFDKVSSELQESEMKRQELERSKQKMLAAISHDLKTPITVILGYTKAICDNLVAESKRAQYMQVIYYKASVLNELIDSFHEFSKAEHPDFKLKLERTDFCEYLRHYLAQRYDELTLQGYHLEVDIPEKSYFVELDMLKYNRILDNLLGNFIRYNPPGTTLFLSIRNEENTLKFILADDGVEIAEELIDTIFQPFITGDTARSSDKSGTGLGLAIVQRFVTMHGGSIHLEVKNVQPYKKIFILILPLSEGA